MKFNQFVLLMEGKDSFIEEKIEELVKDAREAKSKGEKEEFDQILRSIFIYINRNVVHVANKTSSRMIEQELAKTLEKLVAYAKSNDVKIEPDVEDRIEQSARGIKVEVEDQKKDTLDDLDAFMKRDKERTVRVKANKKKEEETEKEDKESDVSMDDEHITTKVKSKEGKEGKKLMKDDDLEAFINRVTKHKSK